MFGLAGTHNGKLGLQIYVDGHLVWFFSSRSLHTSWGVLRNANIVCLSMKSKVKIYHCQNKKGGFRHGVKQPVGAKQEMPLYQHRLVRNFITTKQLNLPKSHFFW